MGMTVNVQSEFRMNIVATTAVAALAFLNVAAAPHVVSHDDMCLSDTFAVTVEIEGATDGGFVAGHPGRASVSVENDEVVFTMGGEEAIAGIYRHAVTVRAPLAAGPATVTATYDASGAMTLMVDQESAMQVMSGEYDPALLEQLSMMEEMVGGVPCSTNFYVGDAAEACMVQPFDGVISDVSVTTNTPADRVAAR